MPGRIEYLTGVELRPPSYLQSSNGFKASHDTSRSWLGTDVVRFGLRHYEPWQEVRDSPTAIGWQTEDGPIFLDETACADKGFQAEYDAWVASGGEDAYAEWYATHWAPHPTDVIKMSIINNLTVEAPTWQAEIGRPSDHVVLAGSWGSTTYPQMVSVATATTPLVAPNIITKPATGSPPSANYFDLSIPDLIDVPAWGQVVCLSTRMTSTPIALIQECAWRLELRPATAAPYRLIETSVRPSAVRRFPRGDGLVFGPQRHFTVAGSAQAGGSRIGWR